MIFHNEKFISNKFVKTTIIDALFYFIINLYLSYFSPYLASLGWNDTLRGYFFSTFAIVGILVAPVIGSISDKVGRFRILIAGFILETLTLLGFVVVRSTTGLFILRIFSSIAFNSVVITALSRINDVIEDEVRPKMIGLFQSLLSLTSMISPVIGGIVADKFGYIYLFAFSFLFSSLILSGIILYDRFYYKKSSSERKKKYSIKLRDGNPFLDMKDMLGFKELRALSIIGVLANLSIPVKFLVYPYLVLDKFGMNNFYLSLVLFIIGFARLFQYPLSKISRRFGSGRGIVFGLLIYSLGLGFLFFVNNYFLLLIIVLFKELGGSLWNVSAWTFMSNIGEKYNIEGKVVGSYSAFTRISASLSFIITGILLSFLKQKIFLIYSLILFFGLILLSDIFLKENVVVKKVD